MIDVPEMIVKNHPNQKLWLTVSLRQEPFVSGSQGPPFPPTFKLAVLGIPSKKRVVGSNGDGMGVLKGCFGLGACWPIHLFILFPKQVYL